MTNLGSLLPSPGTHQFEGIEEKAAQLLELRTETGTVYVRPSPWQRMRLQWIFRNFHVLPPQVLSRRDQRLIARLAQFAVVKPILPVASTDVFGVIERVRARPTGDADRVFAGPSEATQAAAIEPAPLVGGGRPGNQRLGQLGAVGALAAVCVTVILFSALSSSTRPRVSTPPVAPLGLQQVANLQKSEVSVPILPAITSLPVPAKARRVAPPAVAVAPAVAPLEPNPIVASAVTNRRLVSELPPGHFAHPVVAWRNLDGEVRLQALIGSDGLVKEVTALSGDPRLAEAGVRAVRQWHYRPYEELGQPVEVETQVRMNFFGQDAVSIASVPNDSTAQLR